MFSGKRSLDGAILFEIIKEKTMLLEVSSGVNREIKVEHVSNGGRQMIVEGMKLGKCQ